MEVMERIQKVAQYGNSIGFRLTSDMANLSNLKTKDKCKIHVERNKIIITRVTDYENITLEELFTGWNEEKPEKNEDLIAWDNLKPVGGEIL